MTSFTYFRSFFLLFFSLYVTLLANADALFQYQKKTFTSQDLSAALQAQLNDLEQQFFKNKKLIIDQYLLNLKLEEMKTAKKVSLEQLNNELFNKISITETQAKEWYNQNKQRVGNRSYDSIKHDIKHFLKQQEEAKTKQTLIQTIKDHPSFKLSLKAPEPLVVQIKTDSFPTKGSKKALVTIVEFADYQCPHCKHASDSLKTILNMKAYKDKVQLVYIDFPINRSGVSRTIAEGARCAEKQGKYWEYHHMAFDNQPSLSINSPVEFAKKLTLQMDKFNKCLVDPNTKAQVEKAKQEGMRIGVQGTPAIYINGTKTHAHHTDDLIKAIEAVL